MKAFKFYLNPLGSLRAGVARSATDSNRCEKGPAIKDYQLRSFLDVIRTGSLSKAAEEEGIAVQALSQRIIGLEKELGFPLFIRTYQGLTPTPAGIAFQATSSESLRILDSGVAHAKMVAQSSGNTVRFGIPWRIPPLLQSLFVTYRETHSDVTIETVQTTFSDSVKDLARGIFDVVLYPCVDTAVPTESSGIRSRMITRVPYVILFRRDNVLASRSTISPSDLMGKRVITCTPRAFYPLHDFIATWPSGIDIASETENYEAILMDCLADKDTVALFTDDLAPAICPPLDGRPVEDSPLLPIGVFWREGIGGCIPDFVETIVQGYRTPDKRYLLSQRGI